MQPYQLERISYLLGFTSILWCLEIVLCAGPMIQKWLFVDT